MQNTFCTVVFTLSQVVQQLLRCSNMQNTSLYFFCSAAVGRIRVCIASALECVFLLSSVCKIHAHCPGRLHVSSHAFAIVSSVCYVFLHTHVFCTHNNSECMTAHTPRRTCHVTMRQLSDTYVSTVMYSDCWQRGIMTCLNSYIFRQFIVEYSGVAVMSWQLCIVTVDRYVLWHVWTVMHSDISQSSILVGRAS